MKKLVLTSLLYCFCLSAFAQISFEKGYYIDASDVKIEGFIKNIDWKNNPTEFEFKATETSEKKTLSIETVKVFEIYGAAKYERHSVQLDISDQNLTNLGNSDQPKWIITELFLKVLIEGDTTLYMYVDGNLRKYFYRIKNTEVAQLVYKKYMATETRIGENNQFRRQLWEAFKCGDIQKKVKNTSYTKNSLSKIFKQYNTCVSSDIVDYEARVNRQQFHLSVKPGVNFSSVEIGNSGIPNYNFDFENKVGFQLGIEAEFILNFNQNKWGILVEPTYISYAAEQEFTYLQTSSGDRTTNVFIDYAAIEVPLGIRYYSFLSDNSKLFFNAFYMFNITMKDELYAERRELLQAKITPKGNFAIGIGYKYANKFSVEFRYKTPRQLFPANSIWGTYDYNSVAVIFGYTLF
ncbi:porin family protein [Kordia zhangzhouensis]|uniref:porin family protein n=1 Tax=Kordia zhangzhouensis TaxID=1620405 RepID=UPI00062999A5|nr:porin family protein [Kordia zhangzhouensis]